MSAEMPRRRNLTAKELGERIGRSERTARRIAAEPRAEFLARAAGRRAEAVRLRLAGMKYAEIAEALGCSTGTVGSLLHDARQRGEFDPVQVPA